MKKFLFLSAILLTAFLAISITGFYPVALVDGSPIFYRAWRKAEDASRRFANAELARRGARPINFAAEGNAAFLLEGRKETLAALMEDAIITREGERYMDDFSGRSEAHMAEALRSAPNLKRAVASLYGISYDDFKKLVLLPQARRDVLSEELESQGLNFDEWARDAKRRARVRLLFVPFHWNGERIE